MSGYEGFRGRRLAVVESMLHDAFYDGIHRARDHGAEIWLLVQGEEWYTGGGPIEDHPLGRVDRVLHVDTHDWRAVVDALTDTDGKPLVDGVLSFSDYHTEATARAAEALGLPSQGLAAVRAANHKHLLRAALGDDPANVRWRLVTDAAEMDEAIDHVGLPLIAKPPSEAISYGVRKCATREEAHTAWTELSAIRHSLRGQPRPGHVLVEEYVSGTEISVESMTVDGATHFFGATSKDLHKQTMLEEAHSFPVALGPGLWEEVRAAVDRTLRAIGYRQGPAHTEVMLTAAGPRIVEVNPRLPAHMISTMVTDVCGTNPHLDAKLLALGAPHTPEGAPGRGTAGGAAVTVLFPDETGEFTGADGVEDAERLGVTVRFHHAPGDLVADRLDNSASVGFVYARAADADAALRLAREAAALIRIHTRRTAP
ncbi:ATP-grasp domain-containing protein [Streptomyces sp. NPDC048659]|uniref:ATP-grasp domain-containing protein n=1 Tax=Streptomyces sp. NPDC048659 TaxID=3155489 RepID=UPI0034410446